MGGQVYHCPPTFMRTPKYTEKNQSQSAFLLCSKPQILSGQIQYAATKFLTLQRHFLPRACAIHAIECGEIDQPEKSEEKNETKQKLAHIEVYPLDGV